MASPEQSTEASAGRQALSGFRTTLCGVGETQPDVNAITGRRIPTQLLDLQASRERAAELMLPVDVSLENFNSFIRSDLVQEIDQAAF